MLDGGLQISIGNVVHAILKHKTFITVCTVIAIVLSGITFVAMQLFGQFNTSYEVTSSFAVTSSIDGSVYPSSNTFPGKDDYALSEDMTEAVRFIASSAATITQAMEKAKIANINVKDVRDRLSFSRYGETQILTASLQWPSAKEGALLLDAIISETTESARDALDIGTITVIDKSSAVPYESGKMRILIPAFILVMGILVSVGISISDVLINPTILTTGEAEKITSMRSLGSLYMDTALTPEGDDRYMEDRTRVAVSAISHAISSRIKEVKAPVILYVTSTSRGEGRTTIATALARQLARMENRTLLIDLDLEKPGISRYFPVNPYSNINTLLNGVSERGNSSVEVTGMLSVLSLDATDEEIRFGKIMMNAIKEETAKFDFVIIDAPPVGEYPEMLMLNDFSDAAIFVVGRDYASRQEILKALDYMEQSRSRIMGLIFNGSSRPGTSELLKNKQDIRGTHSRKKKS